MTRVWECGSHTFILDRPLVMGIVNVTPDSFSDGGSHADAPTAIAFAKRLLGEGAHIIDVGGESTRPGSDEVAPHEELARVLPVVRHLADAGVAVSIDTRHPDVARECLLAGACIVNDISGFRDPAMVDVAAADGSAGLVVMHMAGEPKTMQEAPDYSDVVTEVAAYLESRCTELERSGIARARIVVDPGIGFGKTLEHNLELLRAGGSISSTGRPVLVGASRKRFIGEITGEAVPAERVAGSIAAALFAVREGAHVVRVHDVAATVQALAVEAALTGA